MFDAYAEHCDHEFNARYDDHRERYAAEIEDLRLEGLMSEELNQHEWLMSLPLAERHEELWWEARLAAA